MDVPASDLEMRLRVLGNLLPLVSVVLFGADLWFLLLLYWLENFIVGGFNALMILTSTGRTPIARMFYAGFFSVHYGVFTFVHLFFLIAFISGEKDVVRYLFDNAGLFVFNAAMLSLSYLWEFVSVWWPRRDVNPEMLMSAPYGRIVVLQLTIILGAFAALFFGWNMGFLIVLILVRTFVDVYLYVRVRN